MRIVGSGRALVPVLALVEAEVVAKERGGRCPWGQSRCDRLEGGKSMKFVG